MARTRYYVPACWEGTPFGLQGMPKAPRSADKIGWIQDDLDVLEAAWVNHFVPGLAIQCLKNLRRWAAQQGQIPGPLSQTQRQEGNWLCPYDRMAGRLLPVWDMLAGRRGKAGRCGLRIKSKTKQKHPRRIFKDTTAAKKTIFEDALGDIRVAVTHRRLGSSFRFLTCPTCSAPKWSTGSLGEIWPHTLHQCHRDSNSNLNLAPSCAERIDAALEQASSLRYSKNSGKDGALICQPFRGHSSKVVTDSTFALWWIC